MIVKEFMIQFVWTWSSVRVANICVWVLPVWKPRRQPFAVVLYSVNISEHHILFLSSLLNNFTWSKKMFSIYSKGYTFLENLHKYVEISVQGVLRAYCFQKIVRILVDCWIGKFAFLSTQVIKILATLTVYYIFHLNSFCLAYLESVLSKDPL